MFPGSMTRRFFLSLPGMVPLAAIVGARSHEQHFGYDHVLGTSLDLVVWAGTPAAAESAAEAVLGEIERLTLILNTRDPMSDISRLGTTDDAMARPELAEVLALYEQWTTRTAGILSIRPRGPGTPRNVDALGKAYIIDRAARAASIAHPRIERVLLNIGGDIVVRGRACDVAIADPSAPQDNGNPLTWIRLDNAAVATSGVYARGTHLIDARTGRPVGAAASATVIAPDAVTANALATALCVADADEGLRLVAAYAWRGSPSHRAQRRGRTERGIFPSRAVTAAARGDARGLAGGVRTDHFAHAD